MKRTKLLLAMLLALAMSLALMACGKTKEFTVSFSGAEVATQTVLKDECAVRPAVAPNKVGYDFVGWYEDEALTKEFDFSKPIQKDTTVYAKFNIKTYTVTFRETNLPAEKVEYNGTLKTADPTPPEGQVFVGWYTNAGKTQAFLKDTKITKNLELWPKFAEKELPAEDVVLATFVNPSKNEQEVVQVKRGEAVPESKVPVFFHKYENFYLYDGWDSDLETPLTEDVTFTTKYVFDESTVIPEHYFNYTLLEDGTYGLAQNYVYENTVESLSQPALTGSKALPVEYNGKPITKILDSAFGSFYFKFILDELLVPECYKTVGDYAFSGGLFDRIYFLGLETIEEKGFGGASCTRKETNGYAYSDNVEFYLPASLKNIEGGHLYTTHPQIGFRQIYLDESNPYFHFEKDTFGNDLMYNAARDTIHYINLNSAKFTLPEHVTNLVANIVPGGVEILTIEGDRESLTNIGGESAKQVIFKGKVKRFESGAFSYFRQVTAFTLPEGLEYIAPEALADVNLARLYVDDDIWRLMSTCGLGGAKMKGGYELMWDELTLIERRNDAIIELGTGPDGGDSFILHTPASSASEYVVPDGVTAFKPILGACFTSDALKRVVVPEGVRELPSGFLNTGEVAFTETGEKGDGNVVWGYEVTDGTEYISLPSTLERLCGGSIRTPSLKGFEWPNGSNLKALETSCIVSFMNYNEILFPDTIETIEKRPFSELYNPKIEGNTGKYITFDGFIYEKLNDRELRLINLPLCMGDEELVFPDTGDYVTTQIAPKAMTENADPANLAKLYSSLKKLVIPEGVQYIGDEAFAFQSSLEELVLPSTLVEIANGAFYYALYLKTVTFNSVEPPKMEYINRYVNELEGIYSIYEIFMTGYKISTIDLTMNYFGPGLESKFIVPAGSYKAYFEVFYDYCGDTYAGRIATDNQEKVTYSFHTDGGNSIFDVENVAVLWDMPVTVWKGEGNKHLQGYYTKDGSVDGDWGERVESYPYFGTPDANGVVNLYARWGDEVLEDGRNWNNAYVVTAETRTLDVRTYERVFFQFTPAEDGMYIPHFSYWGYFNSLKLEQRDVTVDCPVFTVDRERARLNGLSYIYVPGNDRPYWQNANGPSYHPSTTRFLSINPANGLSYSNMKAGTTYYFIMVFGDEMYEYMNNKRETIELTVFMEKTGEYGGVVSGIS